MPRDSCQAVHKPLFKYTQPHLCLRVRSRGSASSKRPPSGFTSRETRAATGSTLKACMTLMFEDPQGVPKSSRIISHANREFTPLTLRTCVMPLAAWDVLESSAWLDVTTYCHGIMVDLTMLYRSCGAIGCAFMKVAKQSEECPRSEGSGHAQTHRLSDRAFAACTS